MAEPDKSWVRLRRMLSLSHVFTADSLAKLCAQTEELAKTTPTHSNLELTKGYATACVICSVAFIESSINEFYEDARDGVLEDVSDELRNLLARLTSLDIFRPLGVLDRFQLALITARVAPFDKAVNPYQDASALVSLRNNLVHPHAEWASLPANREQDQLKRLEQLLVGRFPENQALVGSAYPFFPERCLGAGSADWAATSSVRFVAEFCSRMGLKNLRLRYADVWQFRGS